MFLIATKRPSRVSCVSPSHTVLRPDLAVYRDRFAGQRRSFAETFPTSRRSVERSFRSVVLAFVLQCAGAHSLCISRPSALRSCTVLRSTPCTSMLCCGVRCILDRRFEGNMLVTPCEACVSAMSALSGHWLILATSYVWTKPRLRHRTTSARTSWEGNVTLAIALLPAFRQPPHFLAGFVELLFRRGLGGLATCKFHSTAC